MKINFKEYEEMVKQLNMNRNKCVFIIGTLIVIFFSFLINYIRYGEFVINLIVSLLAGALFYFVMRFLVISSAKKINMTNKLVELYQEIEKDKIIEKVIKEGNVETVSEYKFSDIIKVKEDKNNLYLYLTKNGAIIISKEKAGNIDSLKTIINEKCCIKKN